MDIHDPMQSLRTVVQYSTIQYNTIIQSLCCHDRWPRTMLVIELEQPITGYGAVNSRFIDSRYVTNEEDIAHLIKHTHTVL